MFISTYFYSPQVVPLAFSLFAFCFFRDGIVAYGIPKAYGVLSID